MVVCHDDNASLHQSVSSAFNDDTTADLKIAVGGKIISVHKALLKIRYFRDGICLELSQLSLHPMCFTAKTLSAVEQ